MLCHDCWCFRNLVNFYVSMKSYANAKWKFLHIIIWCKISSINSMKDVALHLRAFSKVKIPNQLDLTTNQTSEIATSNLSHHVKKITPPNPGAPKGIVLQANDSAQQPGAGLYDPTWSLHGGRLKKRFPPQAFRKAPITTIHLLLKALSVQ